MSTRAWWSIIILLLIIIVVLSWFLFTTPAYAPTYTATSTSQIPTTITPQPATAKVVVDTPKADQSVPRTFTVTGRAIGQWFFEASFPIQVRDKDNSKVGQAIAQAQGDWMTTELVPFTATITVSGYSGPATLVLLKDNPSGMPENDDAVEIPIIVQ
ncbi:hypothetical protein A2851_05675 [Candidatus Kaiserbacteria bacterium RIFCSPHIGHO2_01_FULL_53_29]|uniref:Bacterial spore germination immunoglobulin-like domain-containing protein n=1 Tax=Candidatus Kaiserbacteria bacterium RIFCSPHIGHO2_01_FULL_53_29 TaxID=1798480 RepID=A0A1F6CV28_9BACT|nr:MAG: hypothetical protein A2851_05675 [Candidatus Kaiserbacteria bacterium RIFCSPHIGHO2_01_FULL_53_29]